MRKLRQALRLAWEAGLGLRPIGHRLGLSPTTVGESLRRAELDDATGEARLFAGASPLPLPERPRPDLAGVHRELRRQGVTLVLLCQQYQAAHPQGLPYSPFCEHYRRDVGTLDRVMRPPHRAGEKGFIDYAGQTVPVVDSTPGEIREAQGWVATLGASHYTYAEAPWTQALADGIASHLRAFESFGAVPALLVPHHLKSAVPRACRYEPEPNATYQERASHYGPAIRPRSRPACHGSSAGSSLGGAIQASSRCLSSTPPSQPSWKSSTPALSRSWRARRRAHRAGAHRLPRRGRRSL